MFWLISSPFSNLPGILLARGQALARTPVAQGDGLATASPLLLIRVWHLSLCRHWGGDVWFQRGLGRRTTLSFLLWEMVLQCLGGQKCPNFTEWQLVLGWGCIFHEEDSRERTPLLSSSGRRKWGLPPEAVADVPTLGCFFSVAS